MMPDLTPGEERSRYETYSQKATGQETAEAHNDQLADLLDALNRDIGRSAGSRDR